MIRFNSQEFLDAVTNSILNSHELRPNMETPSEYTNVGKLTAAMPNDLVITY